MQAGQDTGQAKFVQKFYERADVEGSKQVCQGFAKLEPREGARRAHPGQVRVVSAGAVRRQAPSRSPPESG